MIRRKQVDPMEVAATRVADCLAVFEDVADDLTAAVEEYNQVCYQARQDAQAALLRADLASAAAEKAARVRSRVEELIA